MGLTSFLGKRMDSGFVFMPMHARCKIELARIPRTMGGRLGWHSERWFEQKNESSVVTTGRTWDERSIRWAYNFLQCRFSNTSEYHLEVKRQCLDANFILEATFLALKHPLCVRTRLIDPAFEILIFGQLVSWPQRSYWRMTSNVNAPTNQCIVCNTVTTQQWTWATTIHRMY